MIKYDNCFYFTLSGNVDFDNPRLEDIPSTSATIETPIEAARSFSDTICKRCEDRAGEHTTIPLADGSRCNGKNGKCTCQGFL
ncbi:MAG: hypothetical protein IH841_07220 [Thaumarchaeota archaeon]|nr:hypothetical protein [Nitrososphaerota archaeon]